MKPDHMSFTKRLPLGILRLDTPVLVRNNMFCKFFDPDKPIGALFRPFVFQTSRSDK